MKQITFSRNNMEEKKRKNREPLLEEDISEIKNLIAEKTRSALTKEDALNAIAHIIIERFYSKKDNDSVFEAKKACISALKRNINIMEMIELAKKAKNPDHLIYLIEKELTGEAKKRTDIRLTKKEIAVLKEVFSLNQDRIDELRKGELPQETKDKLYEELEKLNKKIDFTSCLKGMIGLRTNPQKFAFNVLLLRWGLDGVVPRSLKELASRYSDECYGSRLYNFNEIKMRKILTRILDKISEVSNNASE